MLENALFTLIRSVILTGLTANGQSNVLVEQSYQPTQEGVEITPTVYLNKLPDHRYGSPLKSDIYDSVNSVFIHTETEAYESMFQTTVLATQDPNDIVSYTAIDIANLVTAILQSDAALKTLNAAGVKIYRVTDIRKPQFVDDRDQFEASPNFDFTVTHEQAIISQTPIINTLEFNIKRV